MAKITIKGTITKIGEPKTAGNGEVREVILNSKYHDPATGELKNEDHYPVQIWKEKFPEFEKCYHVSARMEVTGFINGRQVGEGGESKCFLNFVGISFKTL